MRSKPDPATSMEPLGRNRSMTRNPAQAFPSPPSFGLVATVLSAVLKHDGTGQIVVSRETTRTDSRPGYSVQRQRACGLPPDDYTERAKGAGELPNGKSQTISERLEESHVNAQLRERFLPSNSQAARHGRESGPAPRPNKGLGVSRETARAVPIWHCVHVRPIAQPTFRPARVNVSFTGTSDGMRLQSRRYHVGHMTRAFARHRPMKSVPSTFHVKRTDWYWSGSIDCRPLKTWNTVFTSAYPLIVGRRGADGNRPCIKRLTSPRTSPAEFRTPLDPASPTEQREDEGSELGLR